MKKIHILIPSLVAAVSMPFIGLVGCGHEPQPEPEEPRPIFNECEWSLVVDMCNGLEDGSIDEQTFCDTFYIDGNLEKEGIQKKKPTSLDDFVGQPRYLTVNSLPHQVIVLDHQKDTISATSKKASLTFQFVNVICEKIDEEFSRRIIVAWNETGDSKDYWNSTLFHKLNDEEDGGVLSVYEMIQASDNAVAAAIKAVSRTVMTGEWDQPAVLITQPVKLFEPTLADVFSVQGLQNAEEEPVCNHANEYAREGSQYAYYALESNIGQDNFVINCDYQCLDRYDFVSGVYGYWFTSQWKDDKNGHIIIRQRGEFYPYSYADVEEALAPCFCI
ncbi:MAG: hypothetical protein ACOQNV_00870 [Mycoplasmoidaceae bacterium]